MKEEINTLPGPSSVLSLLSTPWVYPFSRMPVASPRSPRPWGYPSSHAVSTSPHLRPWPVIPPLSMSTVDGDINRRNRERSMQASGLRTLPFFSWEVLPLSLPRPTSPPRAPKRKHYWGPIPKCNSPALISFIPPPIRCKSQNAKSFLLKNIKCRGRPNFVQYIPVFGPHSTGC